MLKKCYLLVSNRSQRLCQYQTPGSHRENHIETRSSMLITSPSSFSELSSSLLVSRRCTLELLSTSKQSVSHQLLETHVLVRLMPANEGRITKRPTHGRYSC